MYHQKFNIILAFCFCICFIKYTICFKAQGRAMKFMSVSNRYSKDYFENITSWISNHTFNLEMIILRAINYGICVNLDIQLRLQNSAHYQSLFDYEFDVCKLVNEHFREGLLRSWFKNILKYGNFMENCPVIEGRYFLYDFIMEPQSIPVYLRPGDYRFILNMYFGKPKSKKKREFVSYFKVDVKFL